MPIHLFWGAVRIDYETAVKANIDKQNYSICPRYWYVDAHFICESCGRTFIWSASEQMTWFEDYFFWVDAFPKKCPECCRKKRDLIKMRQEYDQIVEVARQSKDMGVKKKLLKLISEIEDYINVPNKILPVQRSPLCSHT